MSAALGAFEIVTSADVPLSRGADCCKGAVVLGRAGGGAGAEMGTGATLPHQLTLFFPFSISA